MTNKELLDQEVRPLLQEGILRRVLITNEMEIFALCENGYVVAVYGHTLKENGMNIMERVTNREFELLMEEPTLEMLSLFQQEKIKDGKQQALVFTPNMIEKLRVIKQKVALNPAAQLNRQAEAKYIEMANEYLKKHIVEQSAPGMGGR